MAFAFEVLVRTKFDIFSSFKWLKASAFEIGIFLKTDSEVLGDLAEVVLTQEVEDDDVTGPDPLRLHGEAALTITTLG